MNKKSWWYRTVRAFKWVMVIVLLFSLKELALGATGMSARAYDFNNEPVEVIPLECGIARPTPPNALMEPPWDSHPEFYAFDLDYDRSADVIYQDVGRYGSCKDIVESWHQGQDEPDDVRYA